MLRFTGLHPRPMASYLAALGVFRIVARQADPVARSRWAGSTFELGTSLSPAELTDFFVKRYVPSPLVAPWNGKDQGGFKTEAATRASRLLDLVASSSTERLALYRRVIAETRSLVNQPSWQGANTAKNKRGMVIELRNRLPDEAVEFLDSAVALTADDISFPPLLGTGGNIGHLDLVTNYLEHLTRVLGLVQRPRGDALPEEWFGELIDGTPTPGVTAAPGQFDPVGTGGPNQGRGNEAEALANPFAFVLAMEGSLVFAATATRRLGSSEGKASAPFTVINSAPLGFGSAAPDEEAKGELWAPIWERPMAFAELQALMAEGRATWRGGQARSTTDFLRATRTLGTDRGVGGFERFAFLVRNGRSPVAVPVGRVVVREMPGVALTAELDPWLERLRRPGERQVPASVRVARRRVDQVLFDLTTRPSPLRFRGLLVAVAAAERAVQRSPSFQKATGIGPVPPLVDPAWATALQDGSIECGLAWAVAGGWDGRRDVEAHALRDLLRGVNSRSERSLSGFSRSGPRVPGAAERPVMSLLADVAVLRNREAPPPPESEGPSVRGVRPQFPVTGDEQLAPGWAVEALAACRVDQGQLKDWLFAALLVAPGGARPDWPTEPGERFGETAWAVSPSWRVLAPWWGQRPLYLRDNLRFVPVVRTSWAARLRSGQRWQLRGVAGEAAHLLGAAAGPSAIRPELLSVPGGQERASWLLAALMVPTRPRDLACLLHRCVFLPDPTPTHT